MEGWEDWKPGFTDYLYAAFAYSASFGPNDTQMLSQRFKIFEHGADRALADGGGDDRRAGD